MCAGLLPAASKVRISVAQATPINPGCGIAEALADIVFPGTLAIGKRDLSNAGRFAQFSPGACIPFAIEHAGIRKPQCIWLTRPDEVEQLVNKDQPEALRVVY